jgi:arylsulfatase A-like enzyme
MPLPATLPSDVVRSRKPDLTRRLSIALIAIVLIVLIVLVSLELAPGSSEFRVPADARGHLGERPNVVLMVADDLGYGSLGAYGASHVTTPHIDALAARGFRATNAHATGPVCTPSRYSMLTGRYLSRYFNPDRRAWFGEQLPAAAGDVTIAQLLQARGYATGYFGKWHLGWGGRDDREFRADLDWNRPLQPGVLEAGFDTFFGTPFSHNEAPWVFVRDRVVVGLDPKDPIEVEQSSARRGRSDLGVSRGGDAAHAARSIPEIDNAVTNEALRWLSRQQGKPFFLHLSFVAPHVPIVPQKRFAGTSAAGAYGDIIQQLDHHVGRVMSALDTLDVLDNTLIVLTSDNGARIDAEAFARGMRPNGMLLGQKTDIWEGGHRVPFIAVWPGRIPAGSVGNDLLSLSDLPATIAAATRVDRQGMSADDSIDQLPYLTGERRSSKRDWMLLSSTTLTFGVLTNQYAFINGTGSGGSSTSANTRFLTFAELGWANSDYSASGEPLPGAPKVQLYDLGNDLGQATNLATQRKALADGLKQCLAVFMRHMWEGKAGYPEAQCSQKG